MYEVEIEVTNLFLFQRSKKYQLIKFLKLLFNMICVSNYL